MDYAEKRKRMVEEQLIPRGISDPKVLKAFMDVRRHCFVPPHLAADAYSDWPLPIGYGQTISQPYIVALMTQCLNLGGGENVLEVGTGSGYQAAVLAKLCRRVLSIEREKHLAERAKKILSEEGYDNIDIVCGDGTKGVAEKAPFDGIVVTAAAPSVPGALLEQLADGGRLVIPVGARYAQDLVLIKRKGDDLVQENVCGCVFVPLIGEDGWSESERN